MSLFVGNISKNVKSRDLDDAFDRYGRCSINYKGSYAFVTYEDERDGEEAMAELQGKNMGGLKINLEWSRRSGRYDPSSSRRPPRRSRDEIECYTCGEKGHYARECYQHHNRKRRSRSREYRRNDRDYRRHGGRRSPSYPSRGSRSPPSPRYRKSVRDRSDSPDSRDNYYRDERRSPPGRRERSRSKEEKRHHYEDSPSEHGRKNRATRSLSQQEESYHQGYRNSQSPSPKPEPSDVQERPLSDPRDIEPVSTNEPSKEQKVKKEDVDQKPSEPQVKDEPEESKIEQEPKASQDAGKDGEDGNEDAEGKGEIDDGIGRELRQLLAEGGDVKKALEDKYKVSDLKEMITERGHKVKGTRKAQMVDQLLEIIQ